MELRRRRGEAEEENPDEAKIVSSALVQPVSGHEEPSQRISCEHFQEEEEKQWLKVEPAEGLKQEEVKEKEEKEEEAKEKEKEEEEREKEAKKEKVEKAKEKEQVSDEEKAKEKEASDEPIDAFAGPDDEDPFIQTKRQKKKYPKSIMFCTSIYWKMIQIFIQIAIPLLQVCYIPLIKERVLGDGWVGMMYTIVWIYGIIMFVFNSLMTSFSNPGRTQGIETLEEYPLVSDLDELKMRYVPRWCTSCQCWKPPRSHHCGICDKCTLRMDHHCPYMGNCVGFRNLGYFLSMFVFASIGVIVYGILMAIALLPTFWASLIELWTVAVPQLIGNNWYYVFPVLWRLPTFIFVDGIYRSIANVLISNDIAFSVLIVLNFFAVFVVCGMGFSYLRLMFINSTVLEQQLKNSSEYVELMIDVVVPIGKTFYRRNFDYNIREVFGPDLRWRLLPVPIEIPLKVATHPMVSKIVSEILLSRVEEVNREGCKDAVSNMEELGIITKKDKQNPSEVGTVNQTCVAGA